MKINLTLSQFKAFAQLIEEYCGIRLEENRLDDLSLAILVRSKELGLETDGYFSLLREGSNQEELKKMVGYLTINETSFMRYQDQYEILKEVVAPKVKAISGKKEINIWSAGCSTGEEPFSIAIILSEIMPEFKINIIGTDIDNQALEKAKRAVYNQRSVRLLNKSRLKKYFKVAGQNKFVLNDGVREMVQFSHHNLLSLAAPYGFSHFDIIFCRNVIIYFKEETVARIVDLFYKSLVDRGYLFLGHTESLFSVCKEFKSIEFGRAFVYRKTAPATTFQGSSGSHPFCCSDARINAQKAIKAVEKEPKKAKIQIANVIEKSRQITPRHERIAYLKSSESNFEAGGNFNNVLKYYLKKQAGKALKEIEKVKTRDLMADLLRAQVLLELGRVKEARSLCLSMLERQPLSGYPYFILGLAYLKEHNESKALESFKMAAYSLKDFGLPHFFIANAYRRRKDIKRAVLEYKKCSGLLKDCKEDSTWKILSPQFSPARIAKNCKEAFGNRKEKKYVS